MSVYERWWQAAIELRAELAAANEVANELATRHVEENSETEVCRRQHVINY